MNLHAVTGLFSSVPSDWLVLICLAILISGTVVIKGPDWASALAVSLPIALVLFQDLPQTLFLGALAKQFTSPIAQVVVFAILAALMFVLVNRTLTSFGNSVSALSSVLVGIAATVVLCLVWIQIPALDLIWHFGLAMQNLFSISYRLWWLLGSYIVIAVARG